MTDGFVSQIDQGNKVNGIWNNFRVEKIIQVNPQNPDNVAQITTKLTMPLTPTKKTCSSNSNGEVTKGFLRLVPVGGSTRITQATASNAKPLIKNNLSGTMQFQQRKKSEVIVVSESKVSNQILPKPENSSFKDLYGSTNASENHGDRTQKKISHEKESPILRPTEVCKPPTFNGDFNTPPSLVKGRPFLFDGDHKIMRNRSTKLKRNKKSVVKSKNAHSLIPTPNELQDDLLRTFNFAAYQPLKDDGGECESSDEEMVSLYKNTRKTIEHLRIKAEQFMKENALNIQNLQATDKSECTSTPQYANKGEVKPQWNIKIKKEIDDPAQSDNNIKSQKDTMKNTKLRSRSFSSTDESQSKSDPCPSVLIKEEPKSPNLENDTLADKNVKDGKSEKADRSARMTQRNRRKKENGNMRHVELQTDEELLIQQMLAEAWTLLRKRFVDYIHLPQEMIDKHQRDICQEFGYNQDAITMVTDKSLFVWQLIEQLGYP